MAITGINNSSCTSYYASNYKNTVKKTDSEKDSTNTKDGNVTTSTVELKTSRPGVTKTEQIKTGYSNANDYSKYLHSSEKLVPPTSNPIGGMMMSATTEDIIFPKAPPIITPTAMSTTFPRMTNALKSSKKLLFDIFFYFC